MSAPRSSTSPSRHPTRSSTSWPSQVTVRACVWVCVQTVHLGDCACVVRVCVHLAQSDERVCVVQVCVHLAQSGERVCSV